MSMEVDIEPKSVVQEIQSRELNCSELFFRVETPQNSTRRRRLLRRVFGETSKSPFCWALAAGRQSSDVERLLQSCHRRFWNKKAVTVTKVSQLQELAGDLDTWQQILAASALCAYCPEFAIEGEVVEFPEAPTVEFQIQQIELQLWSQLNKDESFNGCGVVEPFEEILERLLDGDGWLEAERFRDQEILVASWIRCALIFKELNISIEAKTESRLDWLCHQIARSMRFDGSLFFGEQGGGINCRSFAKSLIGFSLDESVSKLLKRKPGKAKSKLPQLSELPETSAVSEWAQTSVLRSHWGLGSPALAVLFGNLEIELELANQKTLIQGCCTPVISIDGQLRQPSSEICVTCDLKFDDLDILELEIDFDDWKLQRQMIVTRDGLVIISDNVLGQEESRIEYRCEFPLAEGVEVVEESSTTEAYLRSGDSYGLVLPIALPEWKSARSEDKLFSQEGRLILNQAIDGQCLSAPLVLDLDPKRSLKPRTWRQLTVAENLEIVRQDVAVAYRVQIGKQQWVLYRALSRQGNRTFLGENVAVEFYIGRIDLKGNIESLAEIE